MGLLSYCEIAYFRYGFYFLASKTEDLSKVLDAINQSINQFKSKLIITRKNRITQPLLEYCSFSENLKAGSGGSYIRIRVLAQDRTSTITVLGRWRFRGLYSLFPKKKRGELLTLRTAILINSRTKICYLFVFTFCLRGSSPA